MAKTTLNKLVENKAFQLAANMLHSQGDLENEESHVEFWKVTDLVGKFHWAKSIRKDTSKGYDLQCYHYLIYQYYINFVVLKKDILRTSLYGKYHSRNHYLASGLTRFELEELANKMDKSGLDVKANVYAEGSIMFHLDLYHKDVTFWDYKQFVKNNNIYED